jgi:hypothetical protein
MNTILTYDIYDYVLYDFLDLSTLFLQADEVPSMRAKLIERIEYLMTSNPIDPSTNPSTNPEEVYIDSVVTIDNPRFLVLCLRIQSRVYNKYKIDDIDNTDGKMNFIYSSILLKAIKVRAYNIIAWISNRLYDKSVADVLLNRELKEVDLSTILLTSPELFNAFLISAAIRICSFVKYSITRRRRLEMYQLRIDNSIVKSRFLSTIILLGSRDNPTDTIEMIYILSNLKILGLESRDNMLRRMQWYSVFDNYRAEVSNIEGLSSEHTKEYAYNMLDEVENYTRNDIDIDTISMLRTTINNV